MKREPSCFNCLVFLNIVNQNKSINFESIYQNHGIFLGSGI